MEVFDWPVFEVAWICEETLIMHCDHTGAVFMNVLIEMEMRLKKPENR